MGNLNFINILNDEKAFSNDGILFPEAIDDKTGKCFKLSGCERILSYLKEELGEQTPMLIDFSALPSSFKSNGKMADFVTIFNPNGEVFVKVDNLNEAYGKVYYSLGVHAANLGLFYKKDFFFCPSSSMYYFSEDPEEFDEIKEKRDEGRWLSLGNNVFFKNNSFELSYKKFEDNTKSDSTSKNANVDCQRRNNILLNLYNKHFTNDKKGFLLSVPLIGFPGRKDSKTFEGLGAIFVYFIKKDKPEPEKIREIANGLWFLGLQITYNSMFQIAYEMSERSRIETIKSAKAAIMSRNMSHNLGSHVMFYIKQKLESVDTILQTGALEDLVKSKSLEEIMEKIRGQNAEITNPPMPFLVGLGRFLGYLQERQDYIATVATDYIPYKSTINFKDAIYDELKPELRAQRHQKDSSFSKGKQAANLLLDYIAYSEGFHSSDKIELWFGRFNGGTEPDDVPEELREFDVAIPSGTMGRQAFFSIIENIIRNTAKHDGAKLNGRNLKFRFDILNDELKTNDTQEQDINLNIKSWTNKAAYSSDSITEKYKKHLNYYHLLGITIDLGVKVNDDDKVFNDIKKGLERDYLNAEDRMDDSYKGIKEIRISAAWLRGHGLDTYIPSGEPPAVAIRNNNGHLQYIICLPKPKKVAFISTEAKDLDEKGYQTFSRSEAVSHSKEIADFELIVCTQEDCNNLQKNVGSRFLIVDRNKISNYTNKEVGSIYFEWLNQFFKDYKPFPKLVINDEKAFEYSKKLKSRWTDGNIEKTLEEMVLCNNSDSYSDQIVYSKHYSGQEDLRMNYENARFIEGISGGNSTDRLIRRTPWTMEWYVKQMTAALTKVAVFDERIYNCFVKQGNSQFAEWDDKKLKDWLNSVKSQIEQATDPLFTLHDLVNSIIGYDDDDDEWANIKILLECNNDQWILSEDDTNRTKFLQILHKNDIPTDCTTAALYSQKGIYAFNIIVNERDQKVTIIGFSNENGKECEIATLNNSMKWEPDKPSFFKGKFHFVSIHQGILDKIYGCLEAKDVDEKKIKIINELYDAFMCKVRIDNSDNNENDSTLEFFPRFIIHSGRSKPSNNDMPQKQPFIQFAALDYAIKDCKYSLTELLYSAHYE